MKYVFKKSVFFILVLFFGLLSVSCQEKERPNIVLINIDDLGWSDTGFMGSIFYETPNIDTLSKEGIVFNNGYAAAANCAPSRASLMTGHWPQRHGILTVGKSERGKSADRKIVPVRNQKTISSNVILLPKLLQQNGYKTCHAGKWHLSDNPLQKGFDSNIGGSHAGHPSSYYPPYKNVDLQSDEGKRLTDVVMDGVLDFVQNSDSPFFINYSPYAVHAPIQPVPSLLGKYKNKSGEEGASNVNYATMIENMDWNVGRLIELLKKMGKYENTLIIFTSDNGGLFSVSNQHPLRAGKGSYYEGGIRVPFFFVWKEKIKRVQISETPISNLDIYPTVLQAAGIEPSKELSLDGTDITALLEGKEELKSRTLFWYFPIYLQAVTPKNENRDLKFRTRPGSVIRKGDWKLHYYFENRDVELYNLKDDIGEKKNLAESRADVANKMLVELKDWLKQTRAEIPSQPNSAYQK